jgi:hypothetical protein
MDWSRCVPRLACMSSSIDKAAAGPRSAVGAHPEGVARYLVTVVPTRREHHHHSTPSITAGSIQRSVAGGSQRCFRDGFTLIIYLFTAERCCRNPKQRQLASAAGHRMIIGLEKRVRWESK